MNEELKVKITADAKQAIAETDKFKASLNKIGTTIENGVNKPLSKVKGLISTAFTVGAITAAVTSIKKLTSSIVALGDEVDKTSQKLNMSAEQFQLWRSVAGDCGISASSFEGAIKKLNLSQANAITGTKAQIEAFEALGISQSELAAMDGDKLFSTTIQQLQMVNDTTQRAAIASDLFGKSYSELAPLLNQTAGATQQSIQLYQMLGGTMSNDLVADSAALNDALAHLSYAWQGLKNTIGGAVIPVIKNVVEWITAAIVAVRQLTSSLFGGKGGGTSSSKGNNNQFSNISQGIDNIGSSASGASGAVEKLRRSLMGIDELNVLTDNSSSGGGGGGSGSGGSVGGIDTDESIFSSLNNDIESGIDSLGEKVEKIKSKIEPIITWIKNNFDTIKTVVATIGTALLAWAVTDKLANFINVITSLAGGITTLVLGLALAYKAGQELAMGDTKEGILHGILSLIAGAIGGAVIGAKVGQPVIGAVVGLVLSFVVQIAAFNQKEKEKALQEFENSPFMQEVREIQTEAQAIIDANEARKLRLLDLTGEIDAETQAKITLARKLVNEIYELSESNGPIGEIQTKIEFLDSLGLEGIKIEFDELTGKVITSRAEVEKHIAAIQREAQMEAYREVLIELYKEQYAAEQDVTNASNNLADAQNKLQGAEYSLGRVNSELAAKQERLSYLTSLSTREQSKYSDEIVQTSHDVSDLMVEQEYWTNAVGEATEAVNVAQDAMDGAQVALYGTEVQINNVTNAMNELANQDLSNVTEQIRSLADQTKSIKTKIKLGVELDTTEVEKATFRAAQVADGGWKIKAYAYASGGFPEDGFFFANHGELVGKFSNGKTAVANNQQIISGISQGVYEAMQAANGGNGQSNITVNIDGEKLFNIVVDKNNQKVRNTGYSPLLV